MKNIILILLAMFLFSCESGSSEKNMDFEESEGYLGSSPQATPAVSYGEMDDEYGMEGQKKMDKNKSNEKSNEQGEYQPKIIKTAHIDLEVENFDKSINALKKILRSFKADIHREAENRSPYTLSNVLVIKVDPNEFDALIDELTKLGLNVLRKEINSTDVSEEYYDIQTRLASKRAVLDRYKAILKSAKTIKDILSVEEKLRKVTEEIEAGEGRLRYLNAQVGRSTINLNITQDIDRPNIVSKKRSFLNKLGRSFSNGFEALQNLVLGITMLWPFLLLIPVGIWGFRRIRRRLKK